MQDHPGREPNAEDAVANARDDRQRGTEFEHRDLVLPVARGKWLYRRTRNVSFAAGYGAIALFSGFNAGRFIVIADSDTWLLFPMALLFGAVALALARVAYGCARAGLLVAYDVLEVKGPWLSRRLRPEEVDRFVTGEQAVPFIRQGTAGISMQLKDGSDVPVWALAKEGLIWNLERDARRWQRMADELNRLLERPPSLPP